MVHSPYISDGIVYKDQDAWERKWNTYSNRIDALTNTNDTLGYGRWGTYYAEYQNAEGYEKEEY